MKPISQSAVIVLVTLFAAPECLFAQSAPNGFGVAAPWPAPVATPNGVGASGNQPIQMPGPAVSIGEPVDPLTGLPLRLTQLEPNNVSGSAAIPPQASPTGRPLTQSFQPQFTRPATPDLSRSGIPPLPAPAPRRPPNGQPDASILPPVRPVPILPNPSGSPALLNGGIDPLEPGESAILFPTIMEGDPSIPIPQIDPQPFDAGNRDGELDWIDLIEEYAGRATRSDIHGIPADTPPEDRSWLRLAHFRGEAWYVEGSGDAFGIAAASGSVTLGLAKIKGVTIRPGFTFYKLDGPNRTDISSELHDAEVEVAWMHRFNDCWRMRVGVTGGIYTDFEGDDFAEEFRMSGVGLITYEKEPNLQFVLGAAFVNVESQQILPAAGVVWFPEENTRFELLYPEGRIATKIRQEFEWNRWLYLSGGYFGRTWRTQRTAGGFDDASYQHWRVAVGWETNHEASGVSWFAEVGFALARDLEYHSGLGNYTPQSRAMVRAGFYF